MIIYSWAVLEISAGDPSFRDDDGSASSSVATAMARFAAASGTEHAVLSALAGSRLLVPVVAVLSDHDSTGHDRTEQAAAVATPAGTAQLKAVGQGEKASEMAMPMLIGLDGRRAIPAFTGLESLKRWRPDARPVPVRAAAVWQTACADDAAVVVDVAGPVPLAVEGARLAALAAGNEPPLPFVDPDVREIVAAVLSGQLDVASFELEPGGEDHDLGVVLTLAAGAADADLARLGGEVMAGVMERLGGRLRRGVQVWLAEPDWVG
jgi:hypothetical protein